MQKSFLRFRTVPVVTLIFTLPLSGLPATVPVAPSEATVSGPTVLVESRSNLPEFTVYTSPLAKMTTPVVRKSVFPVPEGPGLGLELNEDWLKSHLALDEKWWGQSESLAFRSWRAVLQII
jgi:hypothetical protein